MKVHFFTKGDKSVPSSRLRAFLLAEELMDKGVESVVHWPSVELISKTKWPAKCRLIFKVFKNLSSVRKGDVIFLQRTIYNKYFFVSIVVYKIMLRRKLIFDFDDAVYLHSYFKTRVLTELADVVTVGSHALYDWAKKYNKNVYLIPTSVKFENYSIHPKNFSLRLEKFTIGWLGNGPAHYENLKILREVLMRVVKDEGYKLLLIGSLGSEDVYNLFTDIKGLEVEFIDKIDPELASDFIKTFDVGVMPLTDDEWSLGKCALKAIEYMACAVPTIASSVGENKYLIDDGNNGFLASGISEWVNKINLLKNDPNLAERIGKVGKETIEKEYTFSINIPKIIKIIEKL